MDTPIGCCGRMIAEACCGAPALFVSNADRLADDGRAIARRAARAGLRVTRADGSTHPIPIGALPLVVDDDAIASRTRLAATLVRATAKVARWRLQGERRDATLAALGATERRLVEATWDRGDELAVARVDFLGADPLAALEVNATIPAMQGYSDIAAEAWLAVKGAGRGDLATLVAANGSNTAALLATLLELHERHRGALPRTIGILCRRGDAQYTELAHIRARFEAAGFETRIVHPDELTWSAGFLHAGVRLDLVYRHLFLSRLDGQPCAALESALAHRGPSGTLVLNRPAPHLEMKSTLALLSQAADDERLAAAIGLDADERAAAIAHVPWTRWLRADEWHGPGFDGALADVAAHPREFVLKRSWSYGGKDVFVGATLADGDVEPLVRHAYPGVTSWRELVARAAADARGGGFVVQRAVRAERSAQVLCTEDGAVRADVVTDYAAFASLGATVGWSGVARASVDPIVNIVRGGAVVPVIRRSVYARMGPHRFSGGEVPL